MEASTDLWSTDLSTWPNGHLFGLEAAWWVQGWLHMLRLSFSQFSCSGGPMDPHSRARLVDKVLPSIDEAFMLMGCVSFSYEAVKWALLILVLACD